DEPGSGARRYASVVATALDQDHDDVIAVAHSASGLLLAVVAVSRPVERLVFLAALIPRLGVSFADQLRGGGGHDVQSGVDRQGPVDRCGHGAHLPVPRLPTGDRRVGSDHADALVPGGAVRGGLPAGVLAQRALLV